MPTSSASMESPTIAASVPGGSSDDGGGSSGPAPVRKRTPGRWKRIPRVLTPDMQARLLLGGMDFEKRSRWFLQKADELEAMDPKGCDSEEAKIGFLAFQVEVAASYRKIARTRPQDIVLRPIQLSDTKEEMLTAEEMEARFAECKGSHVAQLHHFAELALKHYNAKKAEHNKFDLAQALTSNYFSEACGTTYAHVNFTAIPQNNQSDHLMKRLFFAELMLIPELQLCEDAEPMRVLQVSTIDDAPCFGGCHEIRRRIDHKMREAMDYERCHACCAILKHPKGESFEGGHNSTRTPYYSAT
ncbi:uncharacterized protein LOC124665427 [Lolium rigidum]|uniref:uncharacterized protein LOC124665427 n=1 Tax=Lolium rigidum TaxID=89674 RepID=UPI001F5DCF56|nr:uncharacterized protein LOC124665427 [Lolium rigidum]